MPISTYKSILCLRPKDNTTDFLDPIGSLFGSRYIVINDNDEAHDVALSELEQLQQTGLIVFLGHGTSTCLHSARTDSYAQKDFINKNHNTLFSNHNVLFLACRSEQFISRLSGYQNIVGFGNIISSRIEISQEAEQTGEFRVLEDTEIGIFNQSYVYAIKNTLELLLTEKIKFTQLPSYISFFLNKCINKILRDTDLKNRIELAKLLFEFRNEMKHLKGA